MHRGKRLAIALQRRHHVINLGRTEDLLHQPNGIGVQQLVIVGPRRQRLVFVFGIGAEQCAQLVVADVDVINRERVAVHRVDHRLQRSVVAHRLGGQVAQLARIVGIDLLVLEPGLQRILQGEAHLVGHQPVGVVGLLDGGMKQLAHVDQRKQPGNQKDQQGNGQNKFGLQAHGSGTSSASRSGS